MHSNVALAEEDPAQDARAAAAWDEIGEFLRKKNPRLLDHEICRLVVTYLSEPANEDRRINESYLIT